MTGWGRGCSRAARCNRRHCPRYADGRGRALSVECVMNARIDRRRDPLAFGIDGIAVGVERKERAERGPPVGRERLAGPDGGGAQSKDAAVREAHERDPSRIDAWMSRESSKSAVRVGNPLSSRQEPRVRAGFDQPAPTEAVDDKRRISPLLQCSRPRGVDRPIAIAAMRDHHRREGPAAGRKAQLSGQHHRLPANEARSVGRAWESSSAREPDLPGSVDWREGLTSFRAMPVARA